MSKRTVTKMARTHTTKEVEMDGKTIGGKPMTVKVLVKRAKPLPAGHFKSATITSKKGDKKRHVEQAAREKIAAMGGTFISYNRKSRVCHYITKTGQRVSKLVFLG